MECPAAMTDACCATAVGAAAARRVCADADCLHFHPACSRTIQPAAAHVPLTPPSLSQSVFHHHPLSLSICLSITQVLVEKLGTSDKATSHKLCEARRSNPDDTPMPVCGHYCGRLEQLALLEFDRDRKSMSVLCRPVPSTRHTTEHAASFTLYPASLVALYCGGWMGCCASCVLLRLLLPLLLTLPFCCSCLYRQCAVGQGCC